MIVILDINGVLGEVSKNRHKALPDAYLPSGQVFYRNPYAFTFLESLFRLCPNVVLWTSRKKCNAEKIESLFSDFKFRTKLHLEDCNSYAGWHPIKDVAVLRERLCLPVTTPITFIDDNPQYIRLDENSGIIHCPSFAVENKDNGRSIMVTLNRF